MHATENIRNVKLRVCGIRNFKITHEDVMKERVFSRKLFYFVKDTGTNLFR